MSEQLSGRELDKAVAKAMGWTLPSERGRCNVCGWPLATDAGKGCVIDNCSMRPQPDTHASAVPHYSTDFAALPEMLDYVNGVFPRSLCICHHEPVQGTYGWFCDWKGYDDMPAICGRTVPEAVARLVVEIARRR